MLNGELYAMHEPALIRFLEDIEAARALAAESPRAGIWDDDDEDDTADKLNPYAVDDNGQATIPVVGPLMGKVPKILKLLGIEATGYGDIINALAKADADPSVKSAVFAMNTPGGMVAGMDSAWSAARAFSKPLATRNDGLVASAGYCLASGTDHIFSTSPANITGSIGIVVAGYDDSAAREKAGVRKVAIYSKNAPNKGMAFDSEEGRAGWQDLVDAQERIFHARVGEGRGIPAASVGEKYGMGGVFIAQDPDKTKPSALSMGMIDAVSNTWTAAKSPFRASATDPHSQSQAPASAGEIHTEESMKLTEFLASNPDAQAAFNQAISDAVAQGRKSAQADAEKVGKILTGDAYKTNAILQSKGLEALTGKLSVEAFDQLVAMADMIAAQHQVAGATLGPDGKPVPETPPAGATAAHTVETVKALTQDQIVKLTAADFARMAPEVVAAIEKRQAEFLAGGN